MVSPITARRMGQVVQSDLQFHLPQMPRFSPAFEVISAEDHFVIHGAEELVIIRGKTSAILLKILPMLDGSRDLDQLCDHFRELSREAMLDCLALLYSRGLLEDAVVECTLDTSEFDPEILAYFQRQQDTTRNHVSASQGMKKLADLHMGIYTNYEDVGLLQEGLLQAGIGKVTLLSYGSDIRITNEKFILAMVTGKLTDLRLEELAEACTQQRIPWLLSLTCGHTGLLGPYFDSVETACYACFEELQRDTVEFRDNTGSFVHEMDMWTQYTILEVCNFISGLGPSITGMDYMVLNLSNWHGFKRRVPRRPGCKNCLPIEGVTPSLPPLPMQYEYEVQFPSKLFSTPKAHQAHYKTSNIVLSQETKQYDNYPVVPLGKRSIEDCHNVSRLLYHDLKAEDNTELSLDILSSILLCGAGIRDIHQQVGFNEQKVQRYLPTGGNLGSVQIYILLSGVKDMEDGIYYYQPQLHALHYIAPLREPTNLIQALIGTDIGSFESLIVTTGALDRVQKKYSAFAYRVIHLDTGVSYAQMQIAAASFGILLSPLSQWNEAKWCELLQIDPMKEPITGVYTLGGKARDGGCLWNDPSHDQ
jgi:SagB-type dehydrogenase family enzyme